MATAIKLIDGASVGATETVTIGTGGAGGVGMNDGTAGGTSSFGSHCSATDRWWGCSCWYIPY